MKAENNVRKLNSSPRSPEASGGKTLIPNPKLQTRNHKPQTVLTGLPVYSFYVIYMAFKQIAHHCFYTTF